MFAGSATCHSLNSINIHNSVSILLMAPKYGTLWAFTALDKSVNFEIQITCGLNASNNKSHQKLFIIENNYSKIDYCLANIHEHSVTS